MAQTSYTQFQAAGMAGMKADASEDQVDSGAAEGAVGFGLAVVRGTDPAKQVKVPSADAGVFRGVSLQTHLAQTAAGVAEYADKDCVGFMRKGRVWVPVVDAVAVDAAAYFLWDTADAGKFSDDSSGNRDAVPTGVFRTSTSGAGLAVLELNIP